MSILYGDLTDEELQAKIVSLRDKIETVMSGGVARVVAGEGRRLETSGADKEGLKAMLTEAMNERDRRAGVVITGAIPVNFTYGGDFYGC